MWGSISLYVWTCLQPRNLNSWFLLHMYFLWPPLWSSGQSSWLQPGFYSRRYQIFWEVVGLERDPLSLVSITEELLGRKSSGSSLENREYGRRDPSSWPRGTLYPQKLALTSPTNGSLSIGRPSSNAGKDHGFISCYYYYYYYYVFSVVARTV
jgi:hypothetical protein